MIFFGCIPDSMGRKECIFQGGGELTKIPDVTQSLSGDSNSKCDDVAWKARARLLHGMLGVPRLRVKFSYSVITNAVTNCRADAILLCVVDSSRMLNRRLTKFPVCFDRSSRNYFANFHALSSNILCSRIRNESGARIYTFGSSPRISLDNSRSSVNGISSR